MTQKEMKQPAEILYGAEIPAETYFSASLNDGSDVSLSCSGEVLLFGHYRNGYFTPTQIERVALYGHLDTNNNLSDETNRSVQVIDLTMFINDVSISKEEGEKRPLWSIENVPTRLYYSLLGEIAIQENIQEGKNEEDNDGIHQDNHAIHPNADVINGGMIFREDEKSTEDEPILYIEHIFFKMSDAASDSNIGLIQGVDLGDITLQLRGPSPNPPEETKSANSLRVECGNDHITNCDPNSLFYTSLREIGLRFFDVTDNVANIEPLCQMQLDRVCVIWCKKGALDPSVEPDIIPITVIDPITQEAKHNFTHDEAAGLFPSSTDPGIINVYIVNEVTNHGQQGLTFNAGTSEAYIVLDSRAIDDKQNNRFNENLLAHELCHVLGLNHPTENWGPHSLPGARRTIAAPGVPNLATNKFRNFLVFTSEKYKQWYLNEKNNLPQNELQELPLFAINPKVRLKYRAGGYVHACYASD